MATERSGRSSRSAATPQNTAVMGVILVVAAVVVALLLFNAGGGAATSGASDQTPAEAANGASTTTTTAPPVTTTPPGNLEVVVGNGSGVSGRGKATADKLTPLGYTNISAVDATSSPTTQVYFTPGHDLDAQVLAQVMGLAADRVAAMPAQSPLKEAKPTAALTVVVGKDFDPAKAPFTPPSAPTN